MAKIYENARRVLVWLGLGDPDILKAFERLTKEGDYVSRSVQELELRRDLRIAPSPRAQAKTLDEEMEEMDVDIDEELPILRRPTLGLAEPSQAEISAIDKIFQYPWWDRVWVIQEAAVARDLCILCGKEDDHGIGVPALPCAIEGIWQACTIFARR